MKFTCFLPAVVIVRFEQSSYDVIESTSQTEVCVVLTGQTERITSIVIETSDLTAKGDITHNYVIIMFCLFST